MYYIKRITKQDETRTPVISNKSIDEFFNLSIPNRNDTYFIPLFYVNSKKEFYTQIKRKQDNRIYLDKEYLYYFFKGNIVVYRKEEDKILVECFSKYHNQFDFFNTLIAENGNNLLINTLKLPG
jgi:hypothetical protein